MLRRVADSVYWMSRYLERAENVSRFVDVNQSLSLGGSPQWAPLIYASGDEDLYHELYDRDYSASAVLSFLLFNEQNPNSIVSCLVKARENARGIREVLGVSIWEAVNRFYLAVRDATQASADVLRQPADFLEQVRRASHEVIGVMEATMSRNEAWHFSRIGRLLERADKTSRILDVKYFVLLPDASQVGSAFDTVQWTALLESTGALHMYRKRFGRIAPPRVAEFLLFEPGFPRSVRHCVAETEASLHAITGRPAGTNLDPAEERVAELRARLDDGVIDAILRQGLHEFIDDVQRDLNEIGAAMFQGFFEIRPAAEPSSPDQ